MLYNLAHTIIHPITTYTAQTNVTVNVSRYIWIVTVSYLDTLINHVSRYLTVSEHISM